MVQFHNFSCSKTICVSQTCKLTVFVVHGRRVCLISNRHIERIRGAFCDDALYKLTFTFTTTKRQIQQYCIPTLLLGALLYLNNYNNRWRLGRSILYIRENVYTACPEKSEPPSQSFCTDKCKHAPNWTKLSVHFPRSIWVIVDKFHTIPSYHLTDFQFLQIVVTDFSYRHYLLTTHDARHLRHAWRHFVDKQNVVKRR